MHLNQMQVQMQMRMNQMQMKVQMQSSQGNQMQVQVQMPHLHLHLQMQVHLSTSLPVIQYIDFLLRQIRQESELYCASIQRDEVTKFYKLTSSVGGGNGLFSGYEMKSLTLHTHCQV